MKYILPFLMISGMALSLAGCESAKETLGLDKRRTPDEFAVIKQAPLTLPPDYNLRPPRPGAPRPDERPADSAARQTIIGQKDRGSNAPRVKANLSSGESIFLERAGTAQADPNIRQKVDASRREISKEDIPVTKRLFGLYSEEPPATIVDAKEESRRIRENLKNGESITKGDTPTIEN